MASPLNPSLGFRINDVPCAIWVGEDGDQGGIRESWGDRGLELNIEFVVPYDQRIKFLQGLRGGASWDGEHLERQHPWSIPVNPNEFNPSLSGMEGVPYGWIRYICVGTGESRPATWRTDDDGSKTGLPGWGYYDSVIIPARFAVPSYVVGDEKLLPYLYGQELTGYPYTTTKIKASGEVFTCYTNTYKFDSTNDPVNEANVGFIRPRLEVSITRHYMPFVDTLGYDKLIGHVNRDPIVIGTQSYYTESLLYVGYEIESYGDASTGLLYCDITHQLLANGQVIDVEGNSQTSWNYFLNRKGVWDKLVLVTPPATPPDGFQPTPYQQADFIKYIWPDYP